MQKTFQNIIFFIGGIFLGALGLFIFQDPPSSNPVPTVNSNSRLDQQSETELQLRQASVCVPPTSQVVTSNRQDSLFQAVTQASSQIPAGWQFDAICLDPSHSNLFLISASKVVQTSDIPPSTRDRMQKLVPDKDPRLSDESNDYRLYQYYSLATRPTIIKKGEAQKIYEVNILQPLGDELYWYEGLAGCSVKPGFSFTGQSVYIACGSGDNGCYQEQQILIDPFSNVTTAGLACQKNCDLLPDEPTVLQCT